MKIPNHKSAKLSALDIMIAESVPPGGNWKNVPEHVPSKRLSTIRESYARGEGSRSTYYGRLRPDMPAYTINTYFSRPGNGCHLHYDFRGGQHRVLSQREAARIQSFPDSFVFHGSATSICNQIGNAVPPLLAYQIARSLGRPGGVIDLFSGAGGLALGFAWAGWETVCSNDIEAYALETLSKNIGGTPVLGDIRLPDVAEKVVEHAAKFRRQFPNLPLWIIGGPPCQGFSTAGKIRSLDDDRNHLFRDYVAIIDRIRPDGFVFENVTGLLNMLKGEVFKLIADELSKRVQHFRHWNLSAEEYGVPQRRKRVLLIGSNDTPVIQPQPLTELASSGAFKLLPHAISVEEALSDLPGLVAGEDGSDKAYVSHPKNTYQKLMRGLIDADIYVRTIQRVKEEAQ